MTTLHIALYSTAYDLCAADIDPGLNNAEIK